MQEHEYKARDKTVRKMSRDGLMEENLHSGEAIKISRKETDHLTLPGQAEDSVNFQENRHQRAEDKLENGRLHRKYGLENPNKIEDAGDVDFSDTEKSHIRQKQPIPADEKPDSSVITDFLMATEMQSSNGEESEAVADAAENYTAGLSQHSSRMEGVRGHPSGGKAFGKAAAEEISHNRKKKLVQAYARKKKEQKAAEESQRDAAGKESARYRENQETAEQTLDSFREEIKGKTKREQLHKEQKKKTSRLSFGDEDSGMVTGAGMGIAKKAVSAAVTSATVYVHGKGHEAEQDNSALEGAHKAELVGEGAVRYAMHVSGNGLHEKKSRMQFEAVQETVKATGKQAAETEAAKKSAIKRFWQKQRYKKMYQSAKNGEKTTAETVRVSQIIFGKVKSVAAVIARKNKGILGVVAAAILLFVMVSAGLSSCSAILQGTTSTITGTTYPSEDADIYAVEDAYTALENALNDQINSMESRHPGYDEYRYQVDEISHNPYHLISYFTAKYGEFTYAQVAGEIEEIFREQYGLATEHTSGTVTETKTVRVGESLGQVVTSGYCNCPICCGVWSGGPTASGAYPTANHTIAVDASNPFLPMQTKVVMNGVEYVVEDTGAFDQYGVQFDVYYGDHASASAHGHQTWEAYIADSNGSQEVEVTTTKNVDRLNVTLTNHSLDAVLRSRMDDNEEKRYDIYNTTYGNRNYLFDVNSLPSYGGNGGFGYEIPAEALSDQKFANMIHEAEKYLGYPYVWGGASPSTSFDCSGFVSWVINNCGNGWNVGRQTADGLRGYCAYVSPAEAKPGDLIFFQGTYDTPGASHIGIYVGNNMMIHCGNPIQYTSISSAYWQEHFMAFGRIQ